MVQRPSNQNELRERKKLSILLRRINFWVSKIVRPESEAYGRFKTYCSVIQYFGTVVVVVKQKYEEKSCVMSTNQIVCVRMYAVDSKMLSTPSMDCVHLILTG